jgi:hypothetical protein
MDAPGRKFHGKDLRLTFKLSWQLRPNRVDQMKTLQSLLTGSLSPMRNIPKLPGKLVLLLPKLLIKQLLKAILVIRLSMWYTGVMKTLVNNYQASMDAC